MYVVPSTEHFAGRFHNALISVQLISTDSFTVYNIIKRVKIHQRRTISTTSLSYIYPTQTTVISRKKPPGVVGRNKTEQRVITSLTVADRVTHPPFLHALPKARQASKERFELDDSMRWIRVWSDFPT